MGNYLTKPKTEKDIIEEHYDHLSYAFCSMQGWRISMEDDHILEPNFDEDVSLFAIFDGHGGDEVAKFCTKYFGQELKQNQNYLTCNYKEALEQTFEKMDQLMSTKKGQKELNEIRNFEQGISQAGCTALVVLITKKTLYVANAGDCRCLLLNTDGLIYQMNQEHKPENEEEYQRIMNAGCFVVNKRVNETLNLSRALGDLVFKQNKEIDFKNQIVTGHPEVISKELHDNDQLIFLGCDGVFEKLNDVQIRNIIFEEFLDKNPIQSSVVKILDQTLAPQLSAFTQYGYDNMSAILIKLNFKQFHAPLVKNGDIIDLEEENTYFLDNNQRQIQLQILHQKLGGLQSAMSAFQQMTRDKLKTMKSLVNSSFFQKRKLSIQYEKLDFDKLL